MLRKYNTAIEVQFESLDEFFKNEDYSQGAIQEAESTLKLLRMLNLNVQDKTEHDGIQEKIETYNKRLNQIRKDLLFKQGAVSSNPSTIFNKSGEKERTSLQILEDAKKELLNIEGVGRDTLQHLAAQHETMERVKINLKEINKEVGQSNSLLNQMKAWWRG